MQKYYIHFPATDEHGGIYLWDSLESLDRWREGNLAGSLIDTYQVLGDPVTELADVLLVLRPEAMASSTGADSS